MGKLRRARRRRQIQADRRAIRRQRVHDAGPCRRCIDCADDEHHWGDSYVDHVDQTCGGSGTLYCHCGGDGLCVCHNHGEIECYGCDECEHGEEEDDLGFDDDEDDDDWVERL